MEFLYFPDNKLEYLPAVAFLLVTLVVAMFTMIFIIKASQKEAQEAKVLEEKMLNEQTKSQNSSESEGTTTHTHVKPRH
ncbi:hypothetical protein [Caldalkalibacillus salinus]|uniref:hypothetical protein n=1 Tax=Caldalkalibacillus salinus TaxID=2803787 RepID=UPI001924E957|nr:hypothetical protein [Caldalkalibacillus salinus]